MRPPATPSLRSTPKVGADAPAQVNEPPVEPLKKSVEQPAAPPPVAVVPPSEQEVRKAWKAQAEHVKAQGKALLYALMTNFEIEWRPPNEVLVKLSNPVLEEPELRNGQADLLPALRQQLQWPALVLQTQVATPNEQPAKKLYTGQDRFNHLADKNPLLKDLRNLLGLDMEF